MNPLSYIWNWFFEIFLFGGYGWGPFLTPYQEIEAFSRMMRVDIQPWEARVLRELGEVYLLHYRKRSEQPSNLTKTIPMTDSEGLKAMFSAAGQTKPTIKKGVQDGFGRTGSKS